MEIPVVKAVGGYLRRMSKGRGFCGQGFVRTRSERACCAREQAAGAERVRPRVAGSLGPCALKGQVERRNCRCLGRSTPRLAAGIDSVYILHMPRFEWDAQKSLQNKAKHGVSFPEALEIWNGIHLTADNVARATAGESRSATMGILGTEVYVAIWTRRGRCIRLISVRRARDGEKEVFFKSLQR